MKSTSLIHWATIIGAASAALDATLSCPEPPTLAGRNLPTVTSAFASVDSGIKALDAAVQKLSSAADLGGLQTAATNLLSTIKSSTASIAASSELTLQEGVQLQAIVNGVKTTAETLGRSLSAKKSVIQSLSLCKVIQTQVTDMSTASKDLSNAIVSKVPAAARTIATSLAGEFTNTITQIQQQFSDSNCVNSGSPGSGASLGSAQPTTGTGSGSGVAPVTVKPGAASTVAATGWISTCAVAVTVALFLS